MVRVTPTSEKLHASFVNEFIECPQFMVSMVEFIKVDVGFLERFHFSVLLENRLRRNTDPQGHPNSAMQGHLKTGP